MMARKTNEQVFFERHVSGDPRVQNLLKEARLVMHVMINCHSCTQMKLADSLAAAIAQFPKRQVKT